MPFEKGTINDAFWKKGTINDAFWKGTINDAFWKGTINDAFLKKAQLTMLFLKKVLKKIVRFGDRTTLHSLLVGIELKGKESILAAFFGEKLRGRGSLWKTEF